MKFQYGLVVAALVSCAALANTAHAAGLYMPASGARPVARGGAYVAGADDGYALEYNPAGLADMQGFQLTLDAGIVWQPLTYTRVDSGGNPQPAVSGSIKIVPIPTIVASYKSPKLPKWTFAFGIFTPYVPVADFPEKGPQRYSDVQKSGSLIVILEAAAAYKITKSLWIGAGMQDMIISLNEESVVSGCTQVNCAPEDPSFDSPTRVNATQAFNPSANVGLTWARPLYRLGLSVQLPFYVNANGNVYSRLPTDPQFANSTTVGTSATVKFWLPPIVRLGGEWRPKPWARVELGLTYEGWSIQKNYTLESHNIYIDNITGIGRYYIPTVNIPRGFRDTIAVNLGAEFEPIAQRLWLRAGYTLETSSTTSQSASVFQPDALKNMIAAGAGVRIGKVRIDLAYAHLFYNTVTSNWQTSTAYQISPIQPSLKVGVGGGTYRMSGDIASVGLTFKSPPNSRF